jgi:hypothetical protein
LRERRTRASRAMRRVFCDAITRAFGSLPNRTLTPPQTLETQKAQPVGYAFFVDFSTL